MQRRRSRGVRDPQIYVSGSTPFTNALGMARSSRAAFPFLVETWSRGGMSDSAYALVGSAPEEPELGASDVAFCDDALVVGARRHIHPILDALIERGLPVRLHTPNGVHARFIDPPLAAKMRQAGFVTMRLGLESSDPRQEARDGGKVDRATFARGVEALFDAGFSGDEVAAYVLIGRPGQDVTAVRDTVRLAQDLGVQVRTAQFSPIPGTAEWAVAVERGCIAANADPLLHNNSIYPCADAAKWEALKIEIRAGNQVLLAPG
jgi:hypothetical protein